MPKRKITKAAIDTLPIGSTIWDTVVIGFGARRQKDGISYILKRRVGGRQSWLTIGRHGSPWTPDGARKEALSLLGAIAKGADPGTARAAARNAPTLAELAATYLRQHVEAKRKATTANHYRDILNRVVLPRLGNRKAASITSTDIGALHDRLAACPYQANRVLAVVSAMYEFGQRRRLVTANSNPARGIERYSEHARERHLSDEELARLGEALRIGESTGFAWQLNAQANERHRVAPGRRFTTLDPYCAAAIRLLLFTGARLREILNLRWGDVDLDRGLLRLKDSKTGAKVVALNEPAIAVLRGLERIGQIVIANPGTDRPRADLNRPWRAIRRHAALEGVRIHDLRHTHASKAVETGLSLPMIGKLLGHKHAATTQRYAHAQVKPLQEASNVVALRIDRAMSGAA